MTRGDSQNFIRSKTWVGRNAYGCYEIDNNLIENQMRPVALGRKNYLFAGSHEGAKRAAVLYTVLNTCKLNGVNSFQYLYDVLRKVHVPGVQLKELFPHNWKQSSDMR